MPPKKKPVAKKKVTQKQKQRQSQRVVVNIGTAPRKRRRRVKPRESTRGGSSRVLGQFVPLPPYGFPAPPPPNASATNTILPTSNIVPFSQPQQVSASTTNNAFAVRPPAAETRGQVLGRSNIAPPPLVPMMAGQVPSLERFFTNLPIGDALIRGSSAPASTNPDDLFPRTTLRRQTSAASTAELADFEKINEARKRAVAADPETFAARAPPPSPPRLSLAKPDAASNTSLGDAFTGKPLGSPVGTSFADSQREQERMRNEMRAQARQSDERNKEVAAVKLRLKQNRQAAGVAEKPEAAEGYEGY